MAVPKTKRDSLKLLMPNCWYCGKESPSTIDHVTPICNGGSDEMSNLVMACKSCNSSKRALSVEDFRFQCSWNKTKYGKVIKFGAAISLMKTGVVFDGFKNNHKFWYEESI